MKSPYEVLVRPIVTEKTTRQRSEGNQYSFFVHLKANKIEIRQAVKELFSVTVKRVNTVQVHPKSRRMGLYQGMTARRKKAIITLKSGDTIKLFEGTK